MSHFLHIGFSFHDAPKMDELEPAFGNAEDWLRYAPNCWIVRTDAPPTHWLDRLKPLLAAKDRVFIVRIDLQDRSGVLPQWAWDWVKGNARIAAPTEPSSS